MNETKESEPDKDKDIERLTTLLLCLICTHLFFIIQLFCSWLL